LTYTYKDAKRLGQKGVEQLSSLAFYEKTKPKNKNCEEKREPWLFYKEGRYARVPMTGGFSKKFGY
jgi:hypothetical protein